MQKRLYIVRHGETEYNAKGICQGQKLDVGLTDTGRQQAKIAAAKLENFPVGAIYTSPMRRAFETAQIIGHHLHLKPQIHTGLIEGNFGIAEGVSMEMVRRWPEFSDWTNPDPAYLDAHYEGGESKRRIRDRAMRALEDICGTCESQDIVIVTHSAVARLLNWTAGGAVRRMMPNASISELVYEDGKLTQRQNKILLLSCCAPCSCAVIKTAHLSSQPT